MRSLAILAVSVALLHPAPAAGKPSCHTKDSPTGKPTGPLQPGQYWWQPQLSPGGPLMVPVSIPGQTMHVHRNGNRIGQAPMGIPGRGALGNPVSTLLQGNTGRFSGLVPGRAAHRRQSVADRADPDKIASRLRMNPEFAGKVFDTIAPGTAVIITDQPVVRRNGNTPVFQ